MKIFIYDLIGFIANLLMIPLHVLLIVTFVALNLCRCIRNFIIDVWDCIKAYFGAFYAEQSKTFHEVIND